MNKFGFALCVGLLGVSFSAQAIERSYPWKWAPLNVLSGPGAPAGSLVLCAAQGEPIAILLREETTAPPQNTPCPELSGKKFSIVGHNYEGNGINYSAQGDYYIETLQLVQTADWNVTYRFDFTATKYVGTPSLVK